MKNFTFFCKPEVVYGENSIFSLPAQIKKISGRQVLLVIDSYFSKTSIFEEIKNSLEKEKISFFIFDKIKEEPTTEIGDECAFFGRKNKCDIVVGIGGGSCLDTAKAASVIITNGGSVRDFQGLNKVPKPGLPKIMIPTTAGTGSEVTFTAVFIREDEKKKAGINSPYLYPEIAILDPNLTITLPPNITASTGLDALCHAIESYTSKKSNFLTEIISLEAINLIWNSLPVAYNDGKNIEARKNMLYGSFLAGIGLANAGVTAVHSISYPLGGTFKVSHGIANGLLLPYVLEFNFPAIKEKLDYVAKKLKIKSGNLLIEEMKNLLETFHIPRLKEFKIQPKDFPSLAEDALKVSVPIENNPKEITKKDIIEIYYKSY